MLPSRRSSKAGRPLIESKALTAAKSPPSKARYEGIALNASTSVKAASRAFSFAIRSAELPAAGRVAAIAMHAAQVIFVAELEIVAHTVVPLYDADYKPIYVVVRTR